MCYLINDNKIQLAKVVLVGAKSKTKSKLDTHVQKNQALLNKSDDIFYCKMIKRVYHDTDNSWVN